jgi:hypothetical protein
MSHMSHSCITHSSCACASLTAHLPTTLRACLAHCARASLTARVPRSLRACLTHCAHFSLLARVRTSYCCSNYMETPCLCQHTLMNHYKCPCTLIKSYLNVSGGLAFQQGSLLPSASHASVTPFQLLSHLYFRFAPRTACCELF